MTMTLLSLFLYGFVLLTPSSGSLVRRDVTESGTFSSTTTPSTLTSMATTEITKTSEKVTTANYDATDKVTIDDKATTTTMPTTTRKEMATTEVEKMAKFRMSSTTTEMPAVTTPENHHTMPVPEHLQHRNNTAIVPLRGKCNTTEQCSGDHTECRISMCKCQLGYLPRPDNADLCGEARIQQVQPPQADPTMIGVVIGLVLMSITLCVVMRLFAKARFQENRTIFNTPNPRLMNVSLLKGSKTLLRGGSGPGGQRSRRGSQASVNSGGDAPPDSAPPPPPQAAGNKRPRPHRQPSTDTAASSGGAGGESSRPPTASGTNKRSTPRQESVNSNSNV